MAARTRYIQWKCGLVDRRLRMLCSRASGTPAGTRGIRQPSTREVSVGEKMRRVGHAITVWPFTAVCAGGCSIITASFSAFSAVGE